MGGSTRLFRVKTLSIPLLGVLTVLLVAYLVIEPDLKKTSVIVEGIVKTEMDAERPLLVPVLETSRKVYYLVDKTNEASRKEKARKYCPEGRISCYKGERVRVKGYYTERQKSLMTEAGYERQSHKLVVLEFDVLE